MTNDELVALIRSGEDRDGSYMLQLWQQNIGLIGMVAKKYAAYEDIEDLKQQGFLGLCDAVRCYDPEAGASLSSYSVFWIRQSIQRYIDDCTRSVRIPVHCRADISKYKRLCADFQKSIGRKPTEWEICRFMGVGRETLHRIEEAARMGRISSIDTPVGEDGEDTIGDLLPGADNVESSVLDEVQQAQLASTLWPIVDALPGKQGEVIRMRYQEGLTLQACGDKLGFTRQGARTQEANALRELRKPSRSRHLKPFLDEYIYSKAVQGNGSGAFNRTWTSSTERIALKI